MRLRIALWFAHLIGGNDFRTWRAQRVRMGARLAQHSQTQHLSFITISEADAELLDKALNEPAEPSRELSKIFKGKAE